MPASKKENPRNFPNLFALFSLQFPLLLSLFSPQTAGLSSALLRQDELKRIRHMLTGSLHLSPRLESETDDNGLSFRLFQALFKLVLEARAKTALDNANIIIEIMPRPDTNDNRAPRTRMKRGGRASR